MVNDEQYQTAIEGLKAGVARPGALTPDEMTRLSDMVEEYRARKAPAKDTRPDLPEDTRLAIQDVVGKYPGVTEGGFRTMLEKESGLNPRARNPKSGAAGVFQLMPDQQKGIFPEGINNVSAGEQIRRYPKYLESHGVTPTSDADVALAQAAPAMVGKRDETLVYPKGSPAAEQNKAWQDPSGNVTVGSIKAYYKAQSQPKATSDFGEHSSLGPTGMDMLAQNIPVAPEARPTGKYQLQPLAVAEPKLTDYPSTAPGVAAFEQAKAAWLAQHHEGGPRSAEGQSATNRLDVPGPEYRPPKAPDTSGPLLMAHPLDAAMAIGEKLNRARAELPTGLGGDVEHVYEPSEAEFRRAMGPVYGAKIAQLDKHSREYKEYADAKWADIVARAQKQGVPVVRADYAKDQGLAGKAQYGLDAAGAAVAGFDQGLTGGILGAISDKAGSAFSSKRPLNPEASVREELMGAFPIATTAGEIGGILNPRGIAGKAGGLVERGISALGNPARWYSKLGVGMAKGAAGAAAGTAALDAGQDVAGGISGRGGIPLADEPGRIGLGAAIGAPLGMLGAGLGIHGERLRESTPLGKAGNLVETSVVSGAKPTREGADLLARARQEGVSPESLLSNDIERPLSETARAEREALVRKVGDTNQAGYRAHAGKEASYQPVMTAVQDALGEVKNLPFGDQFARPLEKALTHIAEPVPAGNAGEYTAHELRRMGFNVGETMRDLGMPEEMADMVKFNIEPKTATPEATDTLMRIVGKAQDANPGGLHQYDKIERAVKAMQDQFGPEWTAAKKGAGQEFADLQRQHELAGLRGTLDERGLKADQYKAFMGQLRNYGKESTPAENQAVRRLAGAAGKGAELERIPQARSMGEIMDQARLGASIRFRGNSLFPSGALSATPLRLRVDPIFRYIGPNLGSLGLLGPREGGDDIDQISSILNRQSQ